MKIYVGNISFDTTDAMLREAFSKFGEVVSAGVALDKETGRSRGFGVVEMAQPRQAVDAMEALNGTELGGRTIKVGEFHPRSKEPRRDSRGGFRGSFGGAKKRKGSWGRKSSDRCQVDGSIEDTRW